MAAAAWLELPYPEAAVVEERDARGPDRRAGPQPSRAPSCSRRLLLRPRRRDPWARGAPRSARGGLDRRARRPQHAGDLAVRQRMGDAAANGDRRGLRPARRTSRSSVPATSIRPSVDYLAAAGIDDDVGRALAGCDRVYVAFDCDVLRPGELAVFMPEPGGLDLAEAEALLAAIVAASTAGRPRADGIDAARPIRSLLARLVAAAGL